MSAKVQSRLTSVHTGKPKLFALEADFAAHRVHAAFKSVGLRDELDRVQSLSAGKLRRSDGSHTANIKEKGLFSKGRHPKAALPGAPELP